jgi:type III restriction enzyme
MRALDYQARVLDTLDAYLDVLGEEKRRADEISTHAAEQPHLRITPPDFTAEAWQRMANDGRLPLSRRNIPFSLRTDGVSRPVPNITFKVPTGGGKTFLAANAVSRVLSRYAGTNRGFVLWIVPNEAIYSQTLKHLRDRQHPYRQTLDRAAAGRVRILEKSDRLHARDVEGHLCVMLLMLQSSNRQDKETLRMFRDRGDIHGFFPPEGEQQAHAELIRQIPNLDHYGGDLFQPHVKDSLGNALRRIRPIVVLDEGQKATSDLAFRTLYGFNPLFVLELTATPKDVPAKGGANPKPARYANLLVEITGKEIHDEGMIKMPLHLDPRQEADWRSTLAAAKGRLDDLTAKAEAFRAETGRYIRPIMLVQVERTGREQRDVGFIHAEDVREWLLSLGYGEKQIAIKTAEKNDLTEPENLDLLSEFNDVRVIITKSALQEGWDCPFAYVLCSLAASSNRSAMTQLVGRILRQPQALKTEVEALDQCYVITHHAETAEVVKAIRAGLEGGGLSDLVVDVKGGKEQDAQTYTRRIERRRDFRGTEIYLPEVLWVDQEGPRRLDYETDLLARIDWRDFDPSAVVERIPENAQEPDRQMRKLMLSDQSGLEEQTSGALSAGALEFDPVYVTRALTDLLPNPFLLRDIVGATVEGLKQRGFSQQRIDGLTNLLVEELRRELDKARNARAEALFRDDVHAGRIQFRLRLDGRDWRMPQVVETNTAAPALKDENGQAMAKSLFHPLPQDQLDLNRDEHRVAVMLDRDEAIRWWHRNVATASRGYGIQGWKRGKIYPDFVFASQRDGDRRRVVLLETKGEHLQNPDTDYKRDLLDFLTNQFNWGEAIEVGELRLQYDADAVECALVLMDDIPTKLPELIAGRR